MDAPAASVDDYLASFSPDHREFLEQVRGVLLATVPGATETIRYGMPAVMLDGRYVIHYAGWKKHVGLYPVPRMPSALEAEIAPLRTGKDTVALAWSRPVPAELVERLVAAILSARTCAVIE